MIPKKRIIELAQERINELDNGNYLVDVSVSAKNVILVKMDNLNQGVSIKDCVSVSRNIEHNLDREKQDFELKVSSPGLDQPFMVHEQYLKNVGKTINVLTEDSAYKGELTKVSFEEIELKHIEIIKNKKTKKKETIETIHHLKMNEIKETRLVISF
ncbi:MAG: ribosome assembly cofactor RimP [Crocinitomicaceae bacterium]|nr:ribosome assembly cofactor RimP [Crocinitomicaceae bacterium]|tara:strand:+ start:14853 stop:15323 length:471 start_codon:yes stop_codon:yes gene_type:complete